MLLSILLLLPFSSISPAGEQEKSSREVRKELALAVRLLQANQLDRGIEKLQSIVKNHPLDPSAGTAKNLLREHGVGENLQVRLVDRQTFHKRFQIEEKSVLEKGEKVLKDLQVQYRNLKNPFFKEGRLQLLFYDSQARFRKMGGKVTETGKFEVSRLDLKKRTFDGQIAWYFPQEAGTAKDRQTFMDGLLYHEMSHYLNTLQFGKIPQVLDEGIAHFFASRYNTEYYQHYRATERQRIETNARNALNNVQKYQSFTRMLTAPRGFGRGGVMIDRWYGLCYSIVDFIAEGKIGNRKVTMGKLLATLEKIISAQIKKAGKNENARWNAIQRISPQAFLEALVKELYGVNLQVFHQEMVKHILTNYKQR